MKLKVTIDTKGLEKGIDKWIRQKKIATREALDAVAQEVRNTAILHVPVDTGVLKTSIHVQNPNSKQMFRRVGSNVSYSEYIEKGKPQGTGPHGGPRPYMMPALERGKKIFIPVLKKAFAQR